MNKPKLKHKSYYDYHECVDYVEEKYKVSEDDFWLWKSDFCNGNGSYINIDKYDFNNFEFNSDEQKFVEAMIQEFGEDTDYFVCW